MKSHRAFPIATVSGKAEKAIRAGHPWVFDAEIKHIEGEAENGALMDVQNEKGAYLGTGLLSEKSKIRIRILSTNANDDFSERFFARRFRYAIDYRISVMWEDFSCCRLIFGEADGLPGLTVDRYGDILVSQVLSYGMDIRRSMLYEQLVSQLKAVDIRVKGIFERNDVAIRELEGLKQEKGWYEAAFLPQPPSAILEICENGIRYAVDVENGQKTGFFLDQKYNRLAVAKLARDRKVLDCFTHTGSFALNAAKGGAKWVTAVDVSQSALDMAKANAVNNGLDERMDFVCKDVFDLLPELMESHADYDFIILDPPAFTKSRKTIRDAQRGYTEINYRAMKLRPRGGFLATCSCSHFMESSLFVEMLLSAAKDAGRELKLIEARRQSPDHPTLMNIPETDYLKFYLFQVI